MILELSAYLLHLMPHHMTGERINEEFVHGIKLRVKKLIKNVMFFNAHFDHESNQARIGSAKLVHSKAKNLNVNRIPLIFMGDLNAMPNSEPSVFLDSVYNEIQPQWSLNLQIPQAVHKH